MQTLLLDITEENIARAASILRAGGLVAFPTETVYGLGADALNADAVGRVYAAKGRPSDNPMIVHIADPEDLAKLTPAVTEEMRTLAAAFWPGPMTMIVPRVPEVPDTTTGGLSTVGVRLPSDETARALIRAAGCPVAAPSANLSGRPSPTTAAHVVHDLDGRVDAILMGGDCDFGIESSVIDMTGGIPTVLRPGVITREMFAKALGAEVLLDPGLNRRPAKILDPAKGAQEDPDFKPKSPGMKYKHYAPKAAMTVYEGAPEAVRTAMEAEAARLRALGQKVVVLDFLAESATAEEGELAAAHDLFAALRAADEEGADAILAAALPEEGVGFSVMNRMLKSAGYHIEHV
ncbi:MAG: threonylcarbamoyl-AMP synthase [Eubacterium sp.]|nr:threonylcarbamoyl-AMP synthase [Eubacterium sp.]